jgi:hypothetical protein
MRCRSRDQQFILFDTASNSSITHIGAHVTLCDSAAVTGTIRNVISQHTEFAVRPNSTPVPAVSLRLVSIQRYDAPCRSSWTLIFLARRCFLVFVLVLDLCLHLSRDTVKLPVPQMLIFNRSHWFSLPWYQ